MKKYIILLLLPFLGFGQFNPVFFSGNHVRYGDQFVFSTYKINANSIYPAQIKNSSSAVSDIGFDGGGIIDVSAITSFAGGNTATVSKIYDQNNRFGYLSIENATGGAQPVCTDVSFAGLNYIRDTNETMGLFRINGLPLAMSKDYIVNYVFRNETQTNTNRLNLSIITNLTGHRGRLSVCIRPSGSDYVMGVKYLYTTGVNTSDVCYSFPIGNTNTNFTLFTYSYIQGVFKFYRNGTLVTTTTTNEFTGGDGIQGIFVGTGGSDMTNFASNVAASSGKTNDFKTLSLYTGINLTSFDITGYMNTYKSIHGIP